ncbi:hypothetical protein J6590_098132 [Homalodisca vitripennis]|nr:hypothetical protein J6590_098132 [Homalodisca vitripennis]
MTSKRLSVQMSCFKLFSIGRHTIDKELGRGDGLRDKEVRRGAGGSNGRGRTNRSRSVSGVVRACYPRPTAAQTRRRHGDADTLITVATHRHTYTHNKHILFIQFTYIL